MANLPIKCAAKGFDQSPFYLIQSNGESRRYVASFANKEGLERFILWFIDRIQGDSLVRVVHGPDEDEPKIYEGMVGRERLKDLLAKHELVVFHDGGHDLMIKDAGSGDCLAFDEHGLLFLYCCEDMRDRMESFGLEYRADEKLIYEFGHWHVSPPNAPALLLEFITELGLAPEGT